MSAPSHVQFFRYVTFVYTKNQGPFYPYRKTEIGSTAMKVFLLINNKLGGWLSSTGCVDDHPRFCVEGQNTWNNWSVVDMGGGDSLVFFIPHNVNPPVCPLSVSFLVSLLFFLFLATVPTKHRLGQFSRHYLPTNARSLKVELKSLVSFGQRSRR